MKVHSAEVSAVGVIEAAPTTAKQLNNAAWKPQFLWQIGLPLGLFAIIYGKILVSWLLNLWDDPSYSFGLLVFPAALYIAYQRRERLMTATRKPNNWGLLLILLGLGALFIGSLGAELFTSRMSLVAIAAGVVLFGFGWPVLRLLLFPMGLVALVVPLPQLVLAHVALPLQLMASAISEQVLTLLRIPVLREGNIIYLPSMTLGVVEACSGIRSIFSLLALSLLVGYSANSNIAVRTLLAIASIPIAVAVNVFRIFGTGILAQYAGPNFAEGFFHSFYGWLHFVAAFLILLAVHSCLTPLLRRRDLGVSA